MALTQRDCIEQAPGDIRKWEGVRTDGGAKSGELQRIYDANSQVYGALAEICEGLENIRGGIFGAIPCNPGQDSSPVPEGRIHQIHAQYEQINEMIADIDEKVKALSQL